jgi:pyruvate-formate lyase-activating enzyme
MPKTRCPWCANPNTQDDSWSDDFCRGHEAEYEGLSIAELDRREDEQAAEYRDWM